MSDSIHPVLAIDLGDARIGIAATDDMGILAHPVETIHCATTEPLQRIGQLIDQRRIRTLVVGLPLHSDGREGDAAAKARAFGRQLAGLHPEIPLHYIDESFTTLSAAGKLREAGRKARQQKGVIDQAAAVEILNTWLERDS
ncbi:MAG: Holliday junction resolvase RuvX [Akkermansiaceae bacterium]|nr:Holliday junction resolvase RuvX [Akkermansiaceae bacterium]